MILANLPIECKTIVKLHLETKKLRSYTANDYEAVDKYLISLCELSGIKKPSKEVRIGILGFLKEAYADFSLEEIKRAILMAYKFELDIDDINPYGGLTAIWLGKILNAYKKVKNKELQEYNKRKEKLELESKMQISGQDADQIMRQAVISHYTQFFKNGVLIDFGNSLYNYLVKRKLIDLTPEQKKELMIGAMEVLKIRSMNATPDNPFERILKSMRGDIPENIVIQEAKTLAVRNFFKEIHSSNKDISKVL